MKIEENFNDVMDELKDLPKNIERLIYFGVPSLGVGGRNSRDIIGNYDTNGMLYLVKRISKKMKTRRIGLDIDVFDINIADEEGKFKIILPGQEKIAKIGSDAFFKDFIADVYVGGTCGCMDITPMLISELLAPLTKFGHVYWNILASDCGDTFDHNFCKYLNEVGKSEEAEEYTTAKKDKYFIDRRADILTAIAVEYLKGKNVDFVESRLHIFPTYFIK